MTMEETGRAMDNSAGQSGKRSKTRIGAANTDRILDAALVEFARSGEVAGSELCLDQAAGAQRLPDAC